MNCLSNISLKSLKTSKRKNILTIISIILSTCLITSIGIMAIGIQNVTVTLAIKYSGGNFHGLYSDINKKQLNLIENNEKVEKAGKCLWFDDVAKVKSKKTCPYVNIEYMDNNCISMNNMKLQKGSFPKKYNEIAVENWVLKRLNIKPKIGQKLSLQFEKYNKHKFQTFVLSGIIQDDDVREEQSWSTSLLSKKFVLKNQQYSATGCYVRIKDGYDTKQSLIDIGNSANLKKSQQLVNNTYIKSTKWDISMIVTAAILSLIVLFATIIVIYNIFYISIIERINQYGLLRAVGSTKRQIRKIIFKEGLILSCVGIPLGLLLGHIICFIIAPMLSIKYLKIKFSIYVVLIAVLVSLITIVISLLKPQRLAAKVSPVEAIKYGSIQINSRKKLRNSTKKISLGKLAYLNLGRNKKRTILTILSLSMSGLLFLTACTFLTSLDIDNLAKTTFNYEFTLRGNINKTTLHDIEKVNGVKKVITRKSYYDVEGEKEVFTLNAFSNGTLNTFKPYVASGKFSKNGLENKNEIIAAINSTGKCKYHIGDKVTLDIVKLNKFKKVYTTHQKFTICTIVNKKISDVVDSMQGTGDTFITSETAYKKITGNNAIDAVYVSINKNSFDDVKPKIKSISENNSIRYQSVTDTKNQAFKALRGIEIALLGLIGIIALIGILNLINTTITSIVARKKELGMLQAIGLSNNQMKKLLQLEGLYYSGISIILAATLGIPLGYMSYRFIVSAGADYAVYKFPIVPFLIMILIIVFVQLAITYIAEKSMKSESIIDRIRLNE